MRGHAQQGMDFNALTHNTRLDSGVKGAIKSPTAQKDVQHPALGAAVRFQPCALCADCIIKDWVFQT